MTTTLTIQLLNESLSLPDLSIGDAIDIAQIPSDFNEKRLSALIGHLSGDAELAGRLTAQERYYILLNHQATTSHKYNADDAGANDEYMIETIQSDVPNEVQVGELIVSHLRGAHVVVLEGICENVAEWLMGQMACQLSGNLASIIGGDDVVWEPVPATMTDSEINAIIQERFRFISGLSATSAFNDLVDAYSNGANQLTHFVRLGSDNKGLTVIKSGGDGDIEPSRFHTLDHLSGAAARLATCLA